MPHKVDLLLKLESVSRDQLLRLVAGEVQRPLTHATAWLEQMAAAEPGSEAYLAAQDRLTQALLELQTIVEVLKSGETED